MNVNFLNCTSAIFKTSRPHYGMMPSSFQCPKTQMNPRGADLCFLASAKYGLLCYYMKYICTNRSRIYLAYGTDIFLYCNCKMQVASSCCSCVQHHTDNLLTKFSCCFLLHTDILWNATRMICLNRIHTSQSYLWVTK